jgi:cephalosporin hydroxylase
MTSSTRTITNHVPRMRDVLDRTPGFMWACREIVLETRPDVIVETGTAEVGSAYFLACTCELIGTGHVITIDGSKRTAFPKHERISHFTGSSVAPGIIAGVSALVGRTETAMVITSSGRGRGVLEELRAYAPLVSVGNYCVVAGASVEDPSAELSRGSGSREAIEDFLNEGPGREFTIDRSREHVDGTASRFLRRMRGLGARSSYRAGFAGPQKPEFAYANSAPFSSPAPVSRASEPLYHGS